MNNLELKVMERTHPKVSGALGITSKRVEELSSVCEREWNKYGKTVVDVLAKASQECENPNELAMVAMMVATNCNRIDLGGRLSPETARLVRNN